MGWAKKFRVGRRSVLPSPLPSPGRSDGENLNKPPEGVYLKPNVSFIFFKEIKQKASFN